MARLVDTQRELKKVEKNLVQVITEKDTEKLRADNAERRVAELEQMVAEMQSGKRAPADGIAAVARGASMILESEGPVGGGRGFSHQKKRKEQPPAAAISEERVSKDKKLTGKFGSLFGIPDMFRTKTLFGWLNRRGDADAVMGSSRVPDEQSKKIRVSADGQKGRFPRLSTRIVSTFNRFLFVLFVLRTGMCIGMSSVLFGIDETKGFAMFEQVGPYTRAPSNSLHASMPSFLLHIP